MLSSTVCVISRKGTAVLANSLTRSLFIIKKDLLAQIRIFISFHLLIGHLDNSKIFLTCFYNSDASDFINRQFLKENNTQCVFLNT